MKFRFEDPATGVTVSHDFDAHHYSEPSDVWISFRASDDLRALTRREAAALLLGLQLLEKEGGL